MDTFFGLLALSGLFVALEAAPAEKPRKPLVVANAMPKLGPNTFNFMIGACSYKEIVYDTDDCQRRFYMSYRTSPNMPCGKRFAPLQKCVLEKHKSCLKSVLSSSRLQKAMEMYRKSMDLTRKFSCGLKRWKISEYLKGDETCSAGFGEKVDQCASKYLDVLFKTPGSLELCGLHDQYKRCLLATINKMCDFDFSNSSWIFGSKVNPFCDDKQKQALDVQNDDDHNHDDHDAHDHGHDHDHDGDHDADDHNAHDHDHDHRRKRSLSGTDVGGCSYVLCSPFGFVL